MESLIIKLEKINISFDGEKILNNLSLNIKEGEFVTLLAFWFLRVNFFWSNFNLFFLTLMVWMV